MNHLVETAIPLALIFIMFSLGLGLQIADFRRVITHPKPVLAGLGAQMILLPVVAFLLATLTGLRPELAFGLMILAACPGGAPSNALTRLAGGDVALSVTLTGVVSLLSVLTIPLLVSTSALWFLGTQAPELSVGALTLRIFVMATAPLLLGMTIRHFAANFAKQAEPLAYRGGLSVFIVLIILAIYTNRDFVFREFTLLGPIMACFVLIMLGLGYLVASASHLGPNQKRAIAIETGIQNGSIGLTLGTMAAAASASTTAQITFILPSTTYALMMYAIIITGAFILRQRGAAAADF